MRAHELADEAETSRAEAASANQLKDDALALVSHELRTPLNAILGWARLLRVGQLDPPSPLAAIRTVERNAKALARVVGGNVRISPYPVDLVLVVRAAVEELHPTAEEKGVELAAGFDMHLGKPVDPDDLVAAVASLTAT